MRTLSKITFFMFAAIVMALPFAARSFGGAQNNTQHRRPRTPTAANAATQFQRAGFGKRAYRSHGPRDVSRTARVH